MPMIDLALYEFNYSFTVLYYLTIYRETAGQVSVLFSYQSLRIESNVHRCSVVTFWSVFDTTSIVHHTAFHTACLISSAEMKLIRRGQGCITAILRFKYSLHTAPRTRLEAFCVDIHYLMIRSTPAFSTLAFSTAHFSIFDLLCWTAL